MQYDADKKQDLRTYLLDARTRLDTNIEALRSGGMLFRLDADNIDDHLEFIDYTSKRELLDQLIKEGGDCTWRELKRTVRAVINYDTGKVFRNFVTYRSKKLLAKVIYRAMLDIDKNYGAEVIMLNEYKRKEV